MLRVETGITITYQHPGSVECHLLERYGSFGLRDYSLETWNRRAPVPGQPVAYEIVDGVPVFNNFGQGTQADSAFLNKCFDFLLAFWKKNQK